MGKRFYLGLGILAVFLIAGFLISDGIGNVSDSAAQLLEQATAEILEGNMEEGAALAQKARGIWQKSWKAVALVADHSPMDEIDGLFAQMDVFAKAEDRIRLGACCARVAELVEAVADSHKLTWWNFL